MSANLLFNKTILLCKNDDIFCDNCDEYIIVDSYKINDVYNIYDKYKNKKNILIDSRCIEIIIYCFFKYGLDILVYNIINNNIEDIFIWSKHLIKMNNNLFNIVYLKKVLFLYLLTVFYLKNIRKSCLFYIDVNNLDIKNNTSEHIPLTMVMNFLNSPTSKDPVNFDLLMKIKDIIMLKNLSFIEPLENKYTITDVQNCINQLVIKEYFLNI